MLISGQAILDDIADPTEIEIREGLSGNLCRCGGYKRMFEAVRSASRNSTVERQTEPTAVDGPSIGTDCRRRGGRERATGEQEFLADLEFENVLHVKLVTVDSARARIVDIDCSEALKVPGVVNITTAESLPAPMRRFGPVYQDRPILADGETKYHGEPVAAVAAESRQAAEEAASLVIVRYEALPTVSTIEDALATDAPLVQSSELRENSTHAQSNTLKERNFGWGDVDSTKADLVLENTFTFPMVTHFAIEPHGFVAMADAREITLWSPVQHPFLLQSMMAELFDRPLNRVRVLASDPGGAFGGKQNPKFEPLLIHMSMQTGRPCRLVLSLEETFQAVRRASAKVKVRSGFSKSGKILFQDIESDFLIGAYADIAERVMTKANYLACGPYLVPNSRIRARAILSHTTPSCAFRGFGTPQVNWAIESQINIAAGKLKLDGLEIRLRNLARRGDEFIPGDVPADGDWPETLRRAADAIGWHDRRPHDRGLGIAVGIKPGATTGLSNSTIRLLADGSVILYAGTSDMGQGARTIFAQLAADEFGTHPDNVDVIMGDTDVVPFDLQTSASRSTVFMGTAISRACEDIQSQLRTLAADVVGVGEEHITIANGEIQSAEFNVPIVQFVRENLKDRHAELVGHGRMSKPMDTDHPLGGSPAFFEFNCTAFEIEVDEETGELAVHKHVTVGDVGKALNPMQVEMQDEGAAIMGLGHSMMEHIILDEEGRIANLGALDYRIPTTKDMPLSLKAISIENADGPGPYGSKGVSEGALLCTSPALAAAVENATGVTIYDLPLTPERVWSHLRAAEPQ
jgi:CO/xanthine dehydrogenase Mo-binding subunit